MMSPFVIKEKVQPSFIEAILKREPKFNAIIEINNLLATRPIKEISIEDVQAIAKHYNINLKTAFKSYLHDFYSLYLKYCFVDRKLSENEIDELKHLKKLLCLSDKETTKINETVGTNLYCEETEKAIADGRLTEEEKVFLDQLKETLSIHERLAEKIYAQAAQDYFSNFYNNITADYRISPDEEKELDEIAKSLGLSLTMDEAARSTFDKMKMLWLIENDKTPSIEVSLPLVKNEQCYFKTECAWSIESRSSQSLKVLAYSQNRKAELYSVKPEDELKTIEKGILYLTNKRLIFKSQKSTKTVNLNKLEDYCPFLNGVEITYDGGKNTFLRFYDHVDIFSALLENMKFRIPS
jgi:hypothetical protein